MIKYQYCYLCGRLLEPFFEVEGFSRVDGSPIKRTGKRCPNIREGKSVTAALRFHDSWWHEDFDEYGLSIKEML
jgi:hypothetical protein